MFPVFSLTYDDRMPNNLAHFAINADDTARARGFYQNVFGWQFQPWGPPDFFQISTGDKTNPRVQGALQKRREIVPGARMIGCAHFRSPTWMRWQPPSKPTAEPS